MNKAVLRPMSRKSTPKLRKDSAEPAWAVATLFPAQGHWSEEDYLLLPTNRLVELSDGCLDVLPMPTRLHQEIVLFLLKTLAAFVETHGLGKVFMAPLPVRLPRGKRREPDVIFVHKDNKKALEGEYLNGADLVMEVVSPDDPQRDWVQKRKEYARAGIPEYWVVDPQQQQVTVFRLKKKAYAVHGDFRKGTRAASVLLPGFSVDVAEALKGA